MEISDQQYFNIEYLLEQTKANCRFQNTILCKKSIHPQNDPDYKHIKDIFSQKNCLEKMTIIHKKLYGVMLGNMIGDALGTHTEFLELDIDRIVILNRWDDLELFCLNTQKTQRTKFGIISDDFSMARCLADSLLANKCILEPIDLRIRFLLWWHFGYNNGNLYDKQKSYGLGGNINESFSQFYDEQTPFMNKSYGNNNGNGSIMRLGPVSVCYYDDLKQGIKTAELQSFTTHDGQESAECCMLLSYMTIQLLNFDGSPQKAKKYIFDELFPKYKTDCIPILHLLNSEQEPKENLKKYSIKYNRTMRDRNWNWKDPNFQPSPFRVKINSNYYGSYCMDCMYTSFYIIYHTNSFQDAIFKAVNLGGDSDSIAAVTGQIAGAIYGIDEQILSLYNERILQFDDYSTLVKAYKLFNKKHIKTDFKYNKR